MQKPDILKAAIREVFIIAACFALGIYLSRFGKSIPGIGVNFISIKLAAILYIASIACRIAGIFLRMALAVAFILGLIGIALLYFAARYPETFSFIKR